MAKYRLKRHHEPKVKIEPISDEKLAAMERLAIFFERSRFNDYVKLVDKKGRWFRLNFFGGIARGIGLAIGFTLLGALIFVILGDLVSLNIPVISQFIADLLDMVDQYRSIRP